ncbi:hypothetical protein SAMN02745127_01814 [Oceanospirillum multiglobuliferum]|uniref:Uncharacterized protein n=1 Tax=Oceanospirillum multiglobuliferum TaxID=64969 RepID=A0A1T4QAZ4_9GAMM|nr:hypothetical protein BTE48_03740 [Oceanospirillum multiglobuliferum]SKA00834.1 hypothetical protein SAMN02745127_01814 [Oceanospirillum multiglobuliferum]
MRLKVQFTDCRAWDRLQIQVIMKSRLEITSACCSEPNNAQKRLAGRLPDQKMDFSFLSKSFLKSCRYFETGDVYLAGILQV